MDENKVKEFLKVTQGDTLDTFTSLMESTGGNLESTVSQYLTGVLEAGSENGSDKFVAWCENAAKDVLAGKYASLDDVQKAVESIAS